MNYSVIMGRVCTVPSVSIVPINEGEQIFVCKFVVCTKERVECDMDKIGMDFFECIAFEDTAKAVNDGFYKGVKINLLGKIKNFTFQDNNGTSHFTNIILVEHIEYGDTKSETGYKNGRDYGKVCTVPIIAELKEMDKKFNEICENGFLCVDENDYFNIASNNIIHY